MQMAIFNEAQGREIKLFCLPHKVNAFGCYWRKVGDDKQRRNKYSTGLISNIYEILITHRTIRTLPLPNSARRRESAAPECVDLSRGTTRLAGDVPL